MRNSVKRLLRESARQQVSVRTHELHELGIGRLIFIWRQAPSSPMKLRLADVAPHMTEALDKLLRQASLNPGGPV
jgi:RNase P protein component